MKKKKIILTTVYILVPLIFLSMFLVCRFSFNFQPSKVNIGKNSCRTVEVSEKSDAFYMGTSDGRIIKTCGDGTEEWNSRILSEEKGIVSIMETPHGLFAVGEDQIVYKVDEETGDVITKTNEAIGFLDHIDYGDDGLYFVGNVGQNSTLFVVKYDFELQNRKQARLRDGMLDITGFGVADGTDKIVLLGAGGTLYAYPSDLSNFSMGTELYSLDLPYPSLTADLSEPLKMNRKNGEFYILGKNNALIKVKQNADSFEVVEMSKELPCTLKASHLDEEKNILYVTAKEEKMVHLINVDNLKIVGKFSSFFDINKIDTSSKTDKLFMTVYMPDGSDSHVALYKYDKSNINSINLISILKIVGVVLTIITGVVSVVGLVALYSKSMLKVLKRIGRKINRSKWIYLFLLPSLTLLAIFCYYPAISSFIYGFMDYRIGYPLRFVGFENFVEIWSSEVFRTSVINMFVFLVTDIIKALIPPLIFAELIYAMRSERSQYIVRILLYLPGIIPGVASILVWKYGIYGNSGLLNQIIQACGGTPIHFLATPKINIASLIFIGFPFIGSYLIVYGALRNIPDSYYEAAKLEGCGWFKRILKIDIPLVVPQLKYLFVLAFIESVQNVGRIMLTTDGVGDSSVPIYIMYNFISRNELGVSSAIALMIFLFLAVLTTINMRLSGGENEY